MLERVPERHMATGEDLGSPTAGDDRRRRVAHLVEADQIGWKILARSSPLQISLIVHETPTTATFVMHDTHGSPTIDYSVSPPLPAVAGSPTPISTGISTSRTVLPTGIGFIGTSSAQRWCR